MRLTQSEFNELKKNRDPNSRGSKRVQDDDESEHAYQQALEVLHHFQGASGPTLCGSNEFKLQVRVISNKYRVDHTNI